MRSPMVEAQCFVQLAFPVVLKNTMMVSTEWQLKVSLLVLMIKCCIFILTCILMCADRRYSLCWIFK